LTNATKVAPSSPRVRARTKKAPRQDTNAGPMRGDHRLKAEQFLGTKLSTEFSEISGVLK
jgi:hypothetical protein